MHEGGGGGEQLKHAIAIDIIASGVWPLLSNLEDPEIVLDKTAKLVASVTLGSYRDVDYVQL